MLHVPFSASLQVTTKVKNKISKPVFPPVLSPQLQLSFREATDSNLLPHLLMPAPSDSPYFVCRITHLQRVVLSTQPSPLQPAHPGTSALQRTGSVNSIISTKIVGNDRLPQRP